MVWGNSCIGSLVRMRLAAGGKFPPHVTWLLGYVRTNREVEPGDANGTYRN